MRYRWPVAAVLAVVAIRFIPPALASAEAAPLWEDDLEAQRSMAAGVGGWVASDLSGRDMGTGSARFDGEWRFGTYMMAVVGYAQTAMAHPELREEHAVLMDRCIERMLDERMRAFDVAAWGHDPVEDLGSPRGHAGYLGYLNLALSLHRAIEPGSRHAVLNDRITAHLARLTDESPVGLVQTYPGETYPVDNAVFIASVGVHERATGADHGRFLQAWIERLPRFRDPGTGLLYQAVSPETGRAQDGARGSGTAFAAWLLSFVDETTSRDLHRSLRQELAGDVLGFGALREYPRGDFGLGDVDSGPVVVGWGVSATGFALASARAHGDRELFERLYATAQLIGVPVERGEARRFALGGPIGDAMMFALLTARPASEWEPA